MPWIFSGSKQAQLTSKPLAFRFIGQSTKITIFFQENYDQPPDERPVDAIGSDGSEGSAGSVGEPGRRGEIGRF